VWKVDTATVGISDYAQHELGDIVYVELPEVGCSVSARRSLLGVVESVKPVSDLIRPVGGEVSKPNTPCHLMTPASSTLALWRRLAHQSARHGAKRRAYQRR
jgi:hypothetical protein